ncbi:glutathione S-transferase family protein [Alteromonas sp. C1M14]|uniref:glutathione S-transferase family protein n=1 Tax=Alteromonas sp. C1M14 TaxID=2841567 RepID=UPI001C093EBD|nr:glutathione S-transferase family protein [Alteromonas sp. C1M14]MBU2979451.1 glutathione S-transferase family protein [Alteromonas sp. C1M14]
MYTLYGFPRTRSVRVAWALEELGLPYEYTCVNLKAGEHRTEGFVALNPAGKIPTLQTEFGSMSESAAIVTWLLDKHGQQEFMPVLGSGERLLYEQAMAFLITELEPPLWNMVKHDFALPESHRIAQMQEVAKYEFNTAMTTFSALLANNDYLTGPLFTGVDIVAGHILSWAKGSGFELTDDNVRAYADKVLSRPAYRAAWKNEVAHLPT